MSSENTPIMKFKRAKITDLKTNEKKLYCKALQPICFPLHTNAEK